MSNCNPTAHLRQEVERFRSTNRYPGSTVADFYWLVDTVLTEHERLLPIASDLAKELRLEQNKGYTCAALKAWENLNLPPLHNPTKE